jgi:hypothetical protein
MAALKSLSFTAIPKLSGNPILARRAKLIERLEEQKALVENPTFTRVSQRWIKVDGQRQPVEKRHRVSPWWRPDGSGQLVMSVKFGSRPIEFEKGKAGIAVPNKEKLITVIDMVIAAVRNGELDDHLTQASKLRTSKMRKAA